MNDAAHGLTWDEADRTAAVQQTRMAVDWITAQAKSYGVMPDLICDRTEDGSNAALTRSYLVQSAMRGGEDSDESTAFIEEMDALCESLAADSRLAVYGTRHIGFLFYLPISGTSFTMAHYADDGEYFYYVHSYYGKNCAANTLAVSDYSLPVTGVVKAGRVYGTQFHPEKSGDAGLRLLRAFSEL